MPVSILMKPASGQCNMHCDYCFYCDEQARRTTKSFGMMSEETLKQVIRKALLANRGDVSFAFQGGEPTLRGLDFYRKAVEYEKHYNRYGVRISNAFQTNGVLLNDEWCEFFHDNDFLLGISVDGYPSLHDQSRHLNASDGSSFEKALKAIRLMESHKVEFNLLTVLNTQTAPHIEEIYTFYKENGWMYQQYIPCLPPLDSAYGMTEKSLQKEDSYALTPELFGEAMTTLFHLWERDMKTGSHPYIRAFENYTGILLGYPPESCDQHGTCGISYVVEADGSVYPCDFYVLDDYRLGSFEDGRLSLFDEKREALGFVERSRNISEECRSCVHYPLCRCGCQRMRVYDEKNGTWKNYLCEGYKHFFSECFKTLPG